MQLLCAFCLCFHFNGIKPITISLEALQSTHGEYTYCIRDYRSKHNLDHPVPITQKDDQREHKYSSPRTL